MKELAYYNGRIGTPDELTVPFNDRVHFFGDGIYDATIGACGTVYLAQEHLDRFYTSARALDMHVPMEKAALGALLTELLARVEGNTQFVYWQLTRGFSARGHAYPEELQGNLWVLIRPLTLCDPAVPLKLETAEDTRFTHCNIKTLNLIPNVVASQRAKEADCQEAVLHRGSQLTECAHSSLLLLKDGTLLAPVLNELVLPSISRKHIFQIAKQLGVPAKARDISMEEVWTADEVIVCSTSKLIAEADTLDEKPIGRKDQKLFKNLQKEYFRQVENECGWKISAE